MARKKANGKIQELSPREGRRLFDRQAKRWLGMSGDEFVSRWNAGKIDPDDPKRPEVMRLAMLLPLAK